ncbi:MAG: MFS transporter [Desulfovibrio sp.]|jgi:AAHS family cis,cis-muconate transporter-like MFS transporter|nr:MFS transporter [Desulfovibrio sp.]
MNNLGFQDEKHSSRIWIAAFVSVFFGLLVDGMDLMFLSYSLSSLKQTFGITDVQAGSLGSVSLIGMAMGGVLGGIASDRYGRVRILVITILVFSVGTASLGLTQSYGQFIVVRGISAIGLGAEYVVANTLMAEYVPTKYRTTVLGAVQAGWSMGYLAATLLARWIIPAFGWRWLFATALLPVALTFYIQRTLPEPPVWTAMVKRRTAEKAAALAANKPKGKSAWGTLWNNPTSRHMFIAWAVTTTCLQFGYFGVNNWLPSYLEREMHLDLKAMTGYMVGLYTCMIMGKIIAGYLADKFGRRPIFALGGVSTAVFLPLIVMYHTPENTPYLLTFFGFLYGIPYGVNATYMTESFETKIRGSAVGVAYNIGRMGAAVAPLSIGYAAAQHSIGLGFVIMGAAYLLAGLVPLFFIEEKLYNPQAVD